MIGSFFAKEDEVFLQRGEYAIPYPICKISNLVNNKEASAKWLAEKLNEASPPVRKGESLDG